MARHGPMPADEFFREPLRYRPRCRLCDTDVETVTCWVDPSCRVCHFRFFCHGKMEFAEITELDRLRVERIEVGDCFVEDWRRAQFGSYTVQGVDFAAGPDRTVFQARMGSRAVHEYVDKHAPQPRQIFCATCRRIHAPFARCEA